MPAQPDTYIPYGYYWDPVHGLSATGAWASGTSSIPREAKKEVVREAQAATVEPVKESTAALFIPRGSAYIDGRAVSGPTASWSEGEYRYSGLVSLPEGRVTTPAYMRLNGKEIPTHKLVSAAGGMSLEQLKALPKEQREEVIARGYEVLDPITGQMTIVYPDDARVTYERGLARVEQYGKQALIPLRERKEQLVIPERSVAETISRRSEEDIWAEFAMGSMGRYPIQATEDWKETPIYKEIIAQERQREFDKSVREAEGRTVTVTKTYAEVGEATGTIPKSAYAVGVGGGQAVEMRGWKTTPFYWGEPTRVVQAGVWGSFFGQWKKEQEAERIAGQLKIEQPVSERTGWDVFVSDRTVGPTLAHFAQRKELGYAGTDFIKPSLTPSGSMVYVSPEKGIAFEAYRQARYQEILSPEHREMIEGRLTGIGATPETFESVSKYYKDIETKYLPESIIASESMKLSLREQKAFGEQAEKPFSFGIMSEAMYSPFGGYVSETEKAFEWLRPTKEEAGVWDLGRMERWTTWYYGGGLLRGEEAPETPASFAGFGKGLVAGAVTGTPEFISNVAGILVEASPVMALKEAAPEFGRGEYLGAAITYARKSITAPFDAAIKNIGIPVAAYFLGVGQAFREGGIDASSAAIIAPVASFVSRPVAVGYTTGTIASGAYYYHIGTTPPPAYDVMSKPSIMTRVGRKFGIQNLGGDKIPVEITSWKDIAGIGETGSFGPAGGMVQMYGYVPKPLSLAGAERVLIGERYVGAQWLATAGTERVVKQTMVERGWRVTRPEQLTLDNTLAYLKEGKSPIGLKSGGTIQTRTSFEPVLREVSTGYAYDPKTGLMYDIPSGGVRATPTTELAGYAFTPDKVIAPTTGQRFTFISSDMPLKIEGGRVFEAGMPRGIGGFGTARDFFKWSEARHIAGEAYSVPVQEIRGTMMTQEGLGISFRTYISDVSKITPPPPPISAEGATISDIVRGSWRDKTPFSATFVESGTKGGVSMAQLGATAKATSVSSPSGIFVSAIKTIQLPAPAVVDVFAPTVAVVGLQAVKAPFAELVRQPPIQAIKQPEIQIVRIPEVQITKTPYGEAVKQPSIQMVRQPEIQIVRIPEMQEVKVPSVEAIKISPIQMFGSPEIFPIKVPIIEPPPITPPIIDIVIPPPPPIRGGFGGSLGGIIQPKRRRIRKVKKPRAKYTPSLIAKELGVSVPTVEIAEAISKKTGGMFRPSVSGLQSFGVDVKKRR